jgi:hypothetical protein
MVISSIALFRLLERQPNATKTIKAAMVRGLTSRFSSAPGFALFVHVLRNLSIARLAQSQVFLITIFCHLVTRMIRVLELLGRPPLCANVIGDRDQDTGNVWRACMS